MRSYTPVLGVLLSLWPDLSSWMSITLSKKFRVTHMANNWHVPLGVPQTVNRPKACFWLLVIWPSRDVDSPIILNSEHVAGSIWTCPKGSMVSFYFCNQYWTVNHIQLLCKRQCVMHDHRLPFTSRHQSLVE